MSGQVLNIGVDIGETNIKLGIVNDDGKILLQKKRATDANRGSDAIIKSIVEEVNQLLKDASLAEEEINSIGVGVPGTADSANGIVICAPNLFWRNVSIAPIIQRAFHAPVFLTQDTRAAAWAEYQVGGGRSARSVASVTLGTGIGCGMVFEGSIFHGALNTAGEFGHQIVEAEGELCNCARHGCLEAYGGGLAIVRDAKKRIPLIGELLHKNHSDVSVDDVFKLAKQGNEQALELTHRAAMYIGIGLVNLINLNSIELICISGGISNALRELFLDPLIAFVRNRAYELIADKLCMRRSILGDDAPLIGASLLYQDGSHDARSSAHGVLIGKRATDTRCSL